MHWPNVILLRSSVGLLIVGVILVSAWYFHTQQLPIPVSSTTPSLSSDISPDSSVTLLFVGDLMFDRSIRQAAAQKSNEFIFDSLSEWLQSKDIVVANLEGPITENSSVNQDTTPAQPSHFKFTFPATLAQTLAEQNIRVVNLGNNHTSNFGEVGVATTTHYLEQAGVQYFGFLNGVTPSSLKPFLVIRKNNITVGLVNYNQFSTQTPAEVAEVLRQLRSSVDFLVVYTHWDNEYQLAPAAVTVATAHQFIAAGADVIIGSHPHVIQSIEEYQGKKIYYSLGNFVFDQYFEPAVRLGLAVTMTLTKNHHSGITTVNYHDESLYLQSNGQTVRVPTPTPS